MTRKEFCHWLYVHGWCGCYYSDQGLQLMREVLLIAERRHAESEPARFEDFEKACGGEAAAHFVTTWLTRANALQHGFNMGTSWLGPEGRGVLDVLNDAYFKGEIGELLEVTP